MLCIPQVLALAVLPGLAFASGPAGDVIDLTNYLADFLAITVFIGAYALVMAEEITTCPSQNWYLLLPNSSG